MGSYKRRNICIGLIDGVTIPLVLSAVLCQQLTNASTIFFACIAVALGGSMTMAASSYIEGKKYESESFTLASAMAIGISYFLGGLIIALPYIIVSSITEAFFAGLILATVILLLCGYLVSTLHGGNGISGALRSWLTAMVATAAVYAVGGIF